MKIETSYLQHLMRQMIVVAAFVGIAVMAVSNSASAQDNKKDKSGKSLSFNLSADASTKDVGLPVYPGSKPYKEDADSDSNLNMGMSGGSFGFKLAVMKLESTDSPDKIAAYYRKALAKYGTVLDCSKATPSPDKKDSQKSNDKSNVLTCDSDEPSKGNFTYKAGTKDNQHVVGIEPKDKTTVISLVYVQAPKDGDNRKD